MPSELGRGLLQSWSDTQWQALDKLANDTVAGSASFRQLFAVNQQADAFTVRVGRHNVPQAILSSDFEIDLVADSNDDINRKVTRAAGKVALAEDKQAANAIPRNHQQQYKKDLECFSNAREELVSEGVVSGYAVVVSPQVLSDLEGITVGGAVTLRSMVEGLFGTTLLVSSALGKQLYIEHGADKIASTSEILDNLKHDIPGSCPNTVRLR
jgi:uncharacterized linocin/CFP29 family protein